MVCPRMGGGGEGWKTQGKFDIFRFSNINFPTLESHYKSNVHPWGPQTVHSTFNEMIGTDDKFIVLIRYSLDI